MNLFNDNIESKPQDFDFSEGYAETWDVASKPDFDAWDAEQCMDFADDEGLTLDNDPREYDRVLLQSICEQSLGMAVYDNEPTSDLLAAVIDSITAGDGDARIDEWREACRDQYECCDGGFPMMNYRYPVKLRDETNQMAFDSLDGLPLTLIEDLESGDFYLALTGGGMDLSAEICKAYIALGQRPPAHFCRVPRMAGCKYSREFLDILAASCQIAIEWQQSNLNYLESLSNDSDYSASPGPLADTFKIKQTVKDTDSTDSGACEQCGKLAKYDTDYIICNFCKAE